MELIRSTWKASGLAAAAALTLSAAPLQAQIYDNGGPNGANGNEMTARIQAEDFSLAAPATIEAVRFWAFAADDPAYHGSIYYAFLSDAGGQPGAEIRAGMVTPTATDLGYNALGYLSYQLDFDIAPLDLGTGMFWLALHNGPLTTTDRSFFFWETTAANGTIRGLQDRAPFDGGWATTGQEHAFQLYGTQQQVVPEPATLVLLGSGLLGMAGIARRRRQRG